MNVIFLDIDEVLNDYKHQMSCAMYYKKTGKRRPLVDEYKVYLLTEIVKNTDAYLVMSSSKRGSWNNKEHIPTDHNKIIDDVFRKYGLYIYDVTRCFCNRTLEIEDYLNRHPEVNNYLILDDCTFDLKKFINNHLLVIENNGLFDQGLKPNHVKPAIKILTKK